jgi:hypothetical protein
MVRHVVPETQGEQGEVQFGAGRLVADEEVPLPRAGGSPRDRASVDDEDAEARPGRRESARGADDAGPDDDDIGGWEVRHEE